MDINKTVEQEEEVIQDKPKNIEAQKTEDFPHPNDKESHEQENSAKEDSTISDKEEDNLKFFKEDNKT